MTKKYDIISLNGQLYAVDKEAEIEENNIFILGNTEQSNHLISKATGQHLKYAVAMQEVFKTAKYPERIPKQIMCVKIVTSTDPSLGLPLLPEIEEDIQTLRDIAIKKYRKYGSGAVMVGIEAYFDGYKAAKAKKYSEEDMRKAIKMAKQCVAVSEANNGEEWIEKIFFHTEEKIIQSFNLIPKQVELEIEQIIVTKEWVSSNTTAYGKIKPKVDANNFVKIIKWIYE